jgi:hypothetical protein
MRARTLLNACLAVAPIALMAGIGVHARTFVDPYEWPETHQDHIRIERYVPLAAKTVSVLADRHKSEESVARLLAAKWSGGARKKVLLPLVPATTEDFSPIGLKGQIIDIGFLPARRLLDHADERISKHEYDEALENLTLASDSLYGLKYSNFMSVFQTTLVQFQILRRFERIYLKLNSDQKAEVYRCMAEIKGDGKKFAAVASQAKRVILRQYQELEDMTAAMRTASEMVPERSFFEQYAEAKERPVPSRMLADNFSLPDQRTEAGHCLMADERNRLMIAKIMSLDKRRD